MVQNLYKFFLLLFTCFQFSACDESTPQQRALELSLAKKGKVSFVEVPGWIGVYQDTLPCNDCKGTLTRLDLRSDSTYKKSIIYLGKEPLLDNTFSTSGRWSFDAEKEYVFLDSIKEGRRLSFAVIGDTVVQMCDSNGKIFKSDSYKLSRI